MYSLVKISLNIGESRFNFNYALEIGRGNLNWVSMNNGGFFV